ncbi:uncharacterized protein FIBRA_03223 [Fibroporia radiculosa]|uniref:Yeast cell wall synthesis Kre9/Knh1-like N-terminal domain-containing protein n=1 Tax=Fibroporia radiculosa TaxID=599839 RepID=J4GND0_9APHY|nr:uncharacterized protein FIBRA_03223 [Fibroporia radiculosa]CCM01175.1 predicted protein [Fibroporia radiculosa]
MFSKLAAVVAALAIAARASPLSTIPFIQSPNTDAIWSADIISPNLLTVWKVSSNQTVTWDPSRVPQTRTNATGILLLGYEQNDSENLDINTPLAAGFPISAGKVDITVPDVPERNDYIVVLFGDSGNNSPCFTIEP